MAPPRGKGGPNFKIKKKKSLIQNGGTNPHQKFQHSTSIRNCLKIGELKCEEIEEKEGRKKDAT